MPRTIRSRMPVAAAALMVGILGSLYALGRTPAATPDDRPPGVVLLVQDSKPLPVVLKTSRQMLEGKGFPVPDVTVVVCGKAVTALEAGSETEAALDDALAGRVRVVACGISLEKLQLAPDRLTDGVEVVENGLLEVIQLQAKGYLSVEL